jgi:DNA polymerase IV (DinB-like DNA polymerase)|tara:strand:+ start:539 stop:1633 length:1095 start_codon:yes stop_codon:yes gene_type:complete
MENKIVFHVDFDYFYAQCEENRNPDLKGKPVVVCIFSDRGGDSGAVATANYAARKFGVKSGIPIAFAKSRLKNNPESVFISADFNYYSDISSSAMNIMESFADVFEYVGRDEAYLDVTSRSNSDFERASHIAQQLKNKIQKKIKMTCSVGVSPNKLISKIASDYKKPDGLTIIKPEQIMKFLGPLELRKIPGIGKKTELVFTDLNCKIIDDIFKFDVFDLNAKFGRKTGTYIYNAARGIDNNIVKPRAPTIQFSKIITLKENSKSLEFLKENLKILCKQVNTISMEKQKMFRSIGIQFVNEDLSTKTKSRMLKNPTSSISELEKVSFQLLTDAIEDQKLLVRRLGLRVSELSDMEGQSDLTSYF